MARYTPLFYRGAPASIPQVVAHIQRTLTEEDPDYTPLRQRMPPASIPEIVAHIQEYLAENVFVTVEDLGEDIAAYIEAHPDIVGVLTVNGSSGNVALDASDIPIETGEDPTVAGAISYLSSQLALLVADAVLSVNGVTPDDSHNVTLTGANISQDGSTTKKLSETFGPATSSTAGSKGLVPAPAAGDENKVLSGAGTWVVNQSAGGVSSVCNVEPNAQGNVPLKGSDIPLQSMSLQTVAQAIASASTTFTGATSQAAGSKGQVPAPSAGDEDKVLSGGGTWVTPASGTVKQVCSVPPDAQGNVALTGSAVPTSPTDNTPISTSLSNLNNQIVNLQNGIAYVENGDNATVKTYVAGEWIIWKGALYTVNIGGLPQGDPIAGHVAVAPTGGFFNQYESGTYTPTMPDADTTFVPSLCTYAKYGRIYILSFGFYITNATIGWGGRKTIALNLPNGIPNPPSTDLIISNANTGYSVAYFNGSNINIISNVTGNSGGFGYIVYLL